jgi:hypothetical protein
MLQLSEITEVSCDDHWFDKFVAQNAALIPSCGSCVSPGAGQFVKQPSISGVSDANRNGFALTV